MLSAYPNFNIDIADRMNELGRKPRATRRLFVKHSSRVLLGTDNAIKAADYRRYLRFLSTDDECFPYSEANPPPTGRWLISGLDLPGDVLAAVISGNARRLFSSFAGTGR